jgi:hypothetical protein
MEADTDLFDSEWSYETQNELNPKISRFYRNMVQKKISVIDSSAARYENAMNDLVEVFERDVINLTPGKLYVDDSYISCYIIKNSKGKIKRNPTLSTISLTLVCEKGSWITETTTSFRYGATSNTGNLNYPFNYPFNYTSNTAGKKVVNQSYAPSNFRLIIYGACTNPSISIAGHLYNVNCTVETGEYLVIDSASIPQQIYKVKANGETVNQYQYRNRTYNAFEKIPSGSNAVTWSGLFGFDIILLSERSEPIWL